MINNKSEILFVPLINFYSFKSFRLNAAKIKIVPNLGKRLFPKPKLIFGDIDDDLWILEYPVKNINNYKFQFMKHLNKGYIKSHEEYKKKYIHFDVYEYFRRLKFLMHLYCNNDICIPSLFSQTKSPLILRNFEEKRSWVSNNLKLIIKNDKDIKRLQFFIRQYIKSSIFESDLFYYPMSEYEISFESIHWREVITKLFIIFESLCLSKDVGELRFRLAIFISSFLGRDSNEKIKIYDFMRKAYDVRSSIVHGQNEISIHKKVLKCKPLQDYGLNSIQNFIWNLRDLLRRTFIKFLDLSNKKNNVNDIKRIIEISMFS